MYFITGIIVLYLAAVSLATPPACFLSCINELSQQCRSQSDLTCLCDNSDQLLDCLVDICPYGTFESARDHYFGTCLEHKYQIHPPPGQNPPFWNPPVSAISSASPTTSAGSPPTISGKPLPIPTSEPFVTSPQSVPITGPYGTPPPGSLPFTTLDGIATSALPTADADCGIIEICEWEESQSTDDNGNLVIIRKPINVPDKYKPIPNLQMGKPTKVIYILKRIPDINSATASLSPTMLETLTTGFLAKLTTVLPSHTVESSTTSLAHPSKRMKVIRRMRYPDTLAAAPSREVIYDGYLQ